MSEKQTGLQGPSLATAYHFWYSERLADGSAKHPDSAHASGECRCKGGTRGEDEISSAGGSRVIAGQSVLPPASVLILDMEPAPHGSERAYWWPSWPFAFKDESGAVRGSGVLSNETPAIPGFVSIQSPERSAQDGGVWQGSSGYRLICPLDGQTYKHSIEVSAYFGDGSVKSGTLIIPKVSPL